MSVLIITTVGTSLLSKLDHSLTNPLRELEGEYSFDNYEANGFERQKDAAVAYLKSCNELNVYSAEVASLLQIKQHFDKENKEIFKIILLASDSLEGRFCADANREYLSSKVCHDTEIIPIRNLEVKDKVGFKDGIETLKVELDRIFANKNSVDIALNITGGFKGAIPILSEFARRNNSPVFYFHQDSEELLEITFDLQAGETTITYISRGREN